MVLDIELNNYGTEFGITIFPKSKNIEIYYCNKDIDFAIKRGFVPRNYETLDLLARRMLYTFSMRNEMLHDSAYEPLDKDFSRNFYEKFGISINNKVLLKKKANKLSLLNAIAGCTYLKNEVGIIELVINNEKVLWHEALHNLFWDNPYLLYKEKNLKRSKIAKFGTNFLPIPYSPEEKFKSYGETLTESLFPTMFLPYVPLGFPQIPETGIFIASIFSTILTGNVYALLPAGYMAFCCAIKLPYSMFEFVNALACKSRINKIKEKLGDKNAAKLLMIAGPKELKKISRLIDLI